MFGFDVRTARIVWTILLIALLVYIVYAVSTTLLVVVFAVFFFSYLIYPLIDLVDRIRPDRVPRTVSIAVVFAAVISIIATLGAVFGTQIQDEAVHLSQQLPGLLNSNHIFLNASRCRIFSSRCVAASLRLFKAISPKAAITFPPPNNSVSA